MEIDVAGFSIKGAGRKVNRDSFLIDKAMGFLAVADTVGFSQEESVPSRFAIEYVYRSLPLVVKHNGKGRQYALKKAIFGANEKLLEIQDKQPGQGGATTLTCCLLENERAIFAHAGDSRAYLLRNGRISQITRDETLAAILVERDIITLSDVQTHPGRSQLLNALGTQRHIRVTSRTINLKRGDQVVLCTDGVASTLPKRKLVEILTHRGKHFASVAKRMVTAAVKAGSQDDASAVILRIC